MSNRNRKMERAISAQPGLFDTTLAEGTFDILLGLKQLMSKEMNGHDRYLIAAQISRLTGRDLSKEMLTSMSAPIPLTGRQATCWWHFAT